MDKFKICAECGQNFYPDWEDDLYCDDCLDGDVLDDLGDEEE